MVETFSFKKRIVFAGMPDTAYTTLYYLNKIGANIVAVVTPPISHPAGQPFAHYAKKMGYNVIMPENSVKEQAFIAKLRLLNADLGIVTSYSEKFPQELLNTAKDGFVNVHPSLLPEYRGANPYSHVILNGEQTTGVTIHRMDEDFDTGNILLQQPVELTKNETMGTLFNKLNRLSGELLIKLVLAYEQQGLPEGLNQSNLKKPIHKATKILPDSKDTVIRWEKSAEELERFIRGLNPFLPAGTWYKGLYVKVYTAEACNLKSKSEPGTICGIGHTIDVATGNGVLKIRSLQLGNYFTGDAKDFTERIKVKIGEKFELMKE